MNSSKTSPVLLGEVMVNPEGIGQVTVLELNNELHDQQFSKGEIRPNVLAGLESFRRSSM